MLKFFPFEELGRRSLPMERKKKEWKRRRKIEQEVSSYLG